MSILEDNLRTSAEKSMGEVDFETILAPISPADFFADYWQKQPLFHPAGAQGRFSGLLSLQDIDFLIASLTTPDANWIILVKDAAPVPASSFRNKEQLVNLQAVYKAYSAGYTVLLTKLHKRWQPIGRLCRRLEKSLTEYGVLLSRPIQGNTYLTPAESRGFPPHYDDHDTLILQLDGTKRWRIYQALEPFPLKPPAAPLSPDKLPPLVQEMTVRPGDVIYIPRGFYHEALTTGEHSLHLTIGIYPHTWYDLVQRFLMADVRFREALPLGSVQDNHVSEHFMEQFKERVNSLLQRQDLEAGTLRMAHEFLDNLEIPPDDGFQQLNQFKNINHETLVCKREGMSARVVPEADGVRLLFSGSSVRGPKLAEPAFRFILQANTFTAGDLPDSLPPESKLHLVKELIREGLLKIVPHDAQD